MPEDKVYYIEASAATRDGAGYLSTIEISGPDARRVRELTEIIGNIKADADRIVDEETREGRIQPGVEARARRDEIASSNGLDRLQKELDGIVYAAGRQRVSFEVMAGTYGPGGIIEQSEVNAHMVVPQERERARR